MKNKESRLSNKLDTIFWWILRLLPLISYFIYFSGASQTDAQWEYVFSDGDPTMFSALDLGSFIENFFYFPSDHFVLPVFRDIFGEGGVFPLLESYSGIFSYLAYCVSIEILRVVYNVFVFFIRWAYRAIENIGR